MDAPTSVSSKSSGSSSRSLAQDRVPEWDQNSTTALIKMYKEHKCLWDTSHEFYKNRRLRREALTQMANHFNCSLADVEKKLYMLRSSFRKEYRRWNHAKLSAGSNDAAIVRKPQWFALDLLMFLKDDVTKKSTARAPKDLDINASEIQKVFYYDSENSTLTPLEPGGVALDYDPRHNHMSDVKHSPVSLLKRSSSHDSSLESSDKRQRSDDVVDSSQQTCIQEKDAFSAFGHFVAEELRNIKDSAQMHLAKLRIHQILFDATRNFLKVPIPRS